MAHQYQVDSVTLAPGTDTVTLIGSVDTIPVQIQFWFSAIQGLTPIQKRIFVATLMLAAAIPPAPVDVGTGITGGFSQ